MAVKSSLNPRRLFQLEHSELEEICVEISLRGSKWIVIVIYRPPNANAEFWDFLQSNIDEIQSASADYQGVIITGDLNADLLNEQPNSVASRLLSVLEIMEMSQLVTSVTRPSVNDPTSGTIIDHLFTNRPELVRFQATTTRCTSAFELLNLSLTKTFFVNL